MAVVIDVSYVSYCLKINMQFHMQHMQKKKMLCSTVLFCPTPAPLASTTCTHTQMEVDEADEISEKIIYDEVHPQKTIVKTKFAKPKPPGRGRSPYRE